MRYSIIIPVFNRPDEVEELLQSIKEQDRGLEDVEVIVVEDGSKIPCQDVVEGFKDSLNIHYFFKPNSGPGQSRNYGAERACGEFLLILDSDAVLPPLYLRAVDEELAKSEADAFGGPDRAHKDFTAVQKAINYSMTSFFTTGGIRGGKKKMDRFYPRSFNMGIRRVCYKELGGFSSMRFGEDIDLSLRIFKAGLSCRLFPQAWVYHKRRTDLRKFFKQVYNSGIARIHLEKRHPHSMKLVHMLPAAFTVGCAVLLAGEVFCVYSVLPLLLFSLIILFDATLREHSLYVGVLSVAASFVQLIGYGSGFIRAFWRRYILRSGEFQAYQKTFYQ